MQVCIDYENGLFLRINSKDKIRPCVSILRTDNPFLEHDSHVECSLNEIDEFEIEESLLRDGVIGTLDHGTAPQILEKILASPYTSPRDKEQVRTIFAPYVS